MSRKVLQYRADLHLYLLHKAVFPPIDCNMTVYRWNIAQHKGIYIYKSFVLR